MPSRVPHGVAMRSLATAVVFLLVAGCLSLAETPQKLSVTSNSSWLNGTGYYHIVGEVQNTAMRNVHHVRVAAELYAANGTHIGTVESGLVADLVLEPGERAPFILNQADPYPPQISSVRLRAEGMPTGEAPFRNGALVVQNLGETTRYGQPVVALDLLNTGEERALAFTYIVFRNVTGDVVGVTWAPENVNVDPTAYVAPHDSHHLVAYATNDSTRPYSSFNAFVAPTPYQGETPLPKESVSPTTARTSTTVASSTG